MLGYAWRVTTGRPPLWLPAAVCALIAALPGAIVAAALLVPATALLLTADVELGLRLLPAPLSGGPGAPLAWAGAGLAAVALGVAWFRLYCAALMLSDERTEPSVRAAMRATKSSWPRALVVQVEGLVLIAVSALVLALLAMPAASGLGGILVSAGLLLMARAVIRAAVTLALRAIVLDGRAHRDAWHTALSILSTRRGDALAAWMVLLAAGVAVWIGGRLVTPALQETAFVYPAGSTRALGREAVQLLFAVPLKTFLLVLSMGTWTAVYVGGEALESPQPPAREGRRRRAADPRVVRGLAALTGLVLVTNGFATVIETSFENAQRTRFNALAEKEIAPPDARTTATFRAPSSATTGYEVDAVLEGETLEWRTSISYRNQTGEALSDVGVNLYPAAYARNVPEIPLARDILAADISRRFAREARSGTFDIASVEVAGQAADYEHDETALVVALPERLAPGESVDLEVSLVARLPRFPERFGVWRGLTLLGNWIPVIAVREAGEWRLDRFGAVGDPFFSDVADYSVAITAPRSEMVVGTGILVDVAEDDDRRTWRFRAPSVRDAAYAIGGSLRGQQRAAGGVTVRAWYPGDKRLDGADVLDFAARATLDFTVRFGRLPIDEIDVVLTEGFVGGMEYPGMILVSRTAEALEGLPLLPELLRAAGFEDEALRYVVTHEIAHQWWYGAVGNDQVNEPWLDEALAEAATRTSLRAADGNDRTWMMTTLVPQAAAPPGVVTASIQDFESNEDYTRAVYLGGSEVLLRTLGASNDGALDDVLRRYLRDNRLRIATIDDFISATRSEAGDRVATRLERYR